MDLLINFQAFFSTHIFSTPLSPHRRPKLHRWIDMVGHAHVTCLCLRFLRAAHVHKFLASDNYHNNDSLFIWCFYLSSLYFTLLLLPIIYYYINQHEYTYQWQTLFPEFCRLALHVHAKPDTALVPKVWSLASWARSSGCVGSWESFKCKNRWIERLERHEMDILQD